MESKIWSNYIMQELNKAGIPVTHNMDTPDKLIKNNIPLGLPPSALFYYTARTQNLSLEFGIWFLPYEKLNTATTLDDLLEEEITLGTINQKDNKEVLISFNLKKDKACLKIFDILNTPDITLSYIEGVDYDAKAVVDDILAAFLKIYNQR